MLTIIGYYICWKSDRIMKPEIITIIGVFFFFTLLEIIFTNFFHKPEAKKGDGIVEILSALILLAITQPLVMFLGGYVTHLIAPQSADTLSGIPILGGILLFLVFDDM